jgi:hypothetical protein
MKMNLTNNLHSKIYHPTHELRQQKNNVTNYLYTLNSNEKAITLKFKFPVLLYHSLETITIAVKQAAHFAFRRLQKRMLAFCAIETQVHEQTKHNFCHM